jgi:DNA-binding LytR/AlgR family response regulator
MITTLVVDDEPLTRSYLRQALETQGVSILGEAADGALALQLAEDLCPDLIVLDLDLKTPGLTGPQIGSALQRLDPVSLVAYVAGSAQHAVMAFEQGAMDYLVKPVAPERLAKMVARARSRLSDRQARREAERRALERATPAPRPRVPVCTPTAVRLIRIEEIDSIEAREKRVYVRTEDDEYRTDCSMSQLETVLPPDQFFRIHFSYLVKLERVEEILFLGNHRYAVRLTDNRRLPVGRNRYPALRERLGLDRVMNFEGRASVDEPEEAIAPSRNSSRAGRRRSLPHPDATGCPAPHRQTGFSQEPIG